MRRRLWSAVAMVVVLVATALLLRWRSQEPAALAVSPETAQQAGTVLSSSPEESTAEQRIEGAASTAVAHGADEIQVCGGAWIRLSPAGDVDEAEANRLTHVAEIRERIWADLRADSSELARAALLRLNMSSEAILREMTGAPAADCTSAECDAARRDSAASNEARDALARMAATSRDPRVYAMAFNACNEARAGAGACGLLSAEQWAQLDAGNAAPWLHILSAAARRKDKAEQGEALHRIATSSRVEVGMFLLPGLIASHVPPDDAALAGGMSVVYQAAANLQLATPSYAGLAEACRPTAQRDANRRQSCNAAAEVLAERGDTLVDRMTGARIGANSGWPADRTDRIRGEFRAYGDSMVADARMGGNGLSCAELRRAMDQMKRNATIGEMGSLREWVARSGKTPDDFIRLERKATAARQAEASAAASAASAASAAR